MKFALLKQLSKHPFRGITAEDFPHGFNLLHVRASLPLQKDKLIKAVIQLFIIKYIFWCLPGPPGSASCQDSTIKSHLLLDYGTNGD